MEWVYLWHQQIPITGIIKHGMVFEDFIKVTHIPLALMCLFMLKFYTVHDFLKENVLQSDSTDG